MHFSSWIFKLPVLKKYEAITLGRWVFFKYAEADVPTSLIRHEQVHIDQIKQIGVARFYLAYVLYFAAGLLRVGKWNQAYREIPFEAEAYAKEGMNT